MLLYKAALALLKTSPATTPDEWARQSRVYPASSGVPGPRDPGLTPYTIPFSQAFTQQDGRYKRVVLVTAAQSGKTETFLDVIGHRLDTRPAPILFVGPTADLVADQFEPRLVEMFDQAASLRAKIPNGKTKKTLKKIAGVRVRLAHAGSSSQLKSSPAALAIMDEYDEMLANIKGQGDPLGLVEARGETYADFVTGVTSTPSQGTVSVEVDPASGLQLWAKGEEEVVSPIWRLWQEGTRHHWTWKCPHCADYFVPRFDCLAWPKGASPMQAKREAHLICPNNGCIIVEADKAAMNAAGLYVAPGQTIENDCVVGDPPDTSTLSFWVSGLCSPFVTFGDRAETYLLALASGEQDKVQTAKNAGFGEVYSPGGGDVPEWQEVANLKAPIPPRTVPEWAIFLTAGIDVQKNRVVYVIRAWGGRATSLLVDSGELWGDTAGTQVWEDLADLLTQPIDGLPIKLAFIDSGFRPGKPYTLPVNRVYEFCRRFRRFVFPTKGSSVPLVRPMVSSQIEVETSGKAKKYGLELVRLDTDHWKSWVHERLRWEGDAGRWNLHQDTTDDYCQQIVAEARTKKPGTGQPIWVLRQRDNHYLDCEAMAAAAGYRLNVHQLSPKARRRHDDDEPKPTLNPDAPPKPDAPPPKKSGDRFSKFAAMLNP